MSSSLTSVRLLHTLSQSWDCCTCCLSHENVQGWGPGKQGRAGEGAGGPAGGGAKPLPPQTALSGEPAAGDHVLLQGSPPTPTGPIQMPCLALCPVCRLTLCTYTMTILVCDGWMHVHCSNRSLSQLFFTFFILQRRLCSPGWGV